jgi:large subunit ribosomal protein L18
LMHVTADVIASDGKVVATCSDKWVSGTTKTERAENAGIAFADVLKSKNIKAVAFDRNGYLYHGRVKAFAEWLRKWWIQL